MKTFAVSGEVHDLVGLLHDLIKAQFEVRNISKEKGLTVIYLEDEEEKSPLGVAELWIDRAFERPSRKLVQERGEAYRKFMDEKSARLQALRASARRVEETPFGAYEPEERVLTLETPKKEGWFSRLRKLW